MIRRAQFQWFFSKNNFARALVFGQRSGAPLNSEELYACYRLGLYDTVVNSTCKDGHWRGCFARAVSLAACGRIAEATELTCALVSQGQLGRQQAVLADALAPFAPELALEVSQTCATPVALQAALLLRVSGREQASRLLQEAFAAGKERERPELHLFLSNAEAAAPTQQLARMNAFLAAYALPPVVLRDGALPVSQMNITGEGSLPIVRGPLVSILMTAYQSGQRIAYAITSLLEQTYQDIELIVVDDASTDNTGEVVQALATRDPRIVYLRLPCNVGTYVAKSIGLHHAKGEFVTCHDSDDWSHPLRIERQVRPLLESRRIVFTTSYWIRLQDDGIYYARPVHPLIRMNPASPMFRKDVVLKQGGGWDAVRTGADSEFAARLTLVFGRRARHRVVQPLAFGAHRPDSLMTAAETGYSTAGMSPTRLAYWESWGHHHINELRAGRKPFIPIDMLSKRRFAAPAHIVVPRQDIEICLAKSLA